MFTLHLTNENDNTFYEFKAVWQCGYIYYISEKLNAKMQHEQLKPFPFYLKG